MFIRNSIKVSGLIAKNSNVSISKRFASQSSPISSSEASTSKTSPNTGIGGSMKDELRDMKKDMKNQNRDFPPVRENAQLENDSASLNKDSSYNTRIKSTPGFGASEGMAMDTKKGEKFHGVVENNTDYGKTGSSVSSASHPAPQQQDMDNIRNKTGSGSVSKMEKGNEKKVEDAMQRNWDSKSSSSNSSSKKKEEDNQNDLIHQIENKIVDAVDHSSLSQNAEKFDKMAGNAVNKVSEGLKKGAEYYQKTVNPETYSERFSKFAKELNGKQSEEFKNAKDTKHTVHSAEQMNWGQQNSSSSSSSSPSSNSTSSTTSSVASAAASTASSVASNLKDKADELIHSSTAENLKKNAEGIFEKVKSTVGNMMGSGSGSSNNNNNNVNSKDRK